MNNNIPRTIAVLAKTPFPTEVMTPVALLEVLIELCAVAGKPDLCRQIASCICANRPPLEVIRAND